MAEDPVIPQNTIQGFKADPAWAEAAKSAFDMAGLSFEDISGKDLITMPRDEFRQISDKLKILVQHRTMPPPQTS